MKCRHPTKYPHLPHLTNVDVIGSLVKSHTIPASFRGERSHNMCRGHWQRPCYWQKRLSPLFQAYRGSDNSVNSEENISSVNWPSMTPTCLGRLENWRREFKKYLLNLTRFIHKQIAKTISESITWPQVYLDIHTNALLRLSHSCFLRSRYTWPTVTQSGTSTTNSLGSLNVQ